MFFILLKFAENKERAGEYMDGHNAWLKRGFDEGVFLVAGSLQSGIGGGIVAHNATLEEIQDRINEDPFVAEKVVKPVVHEVSPAKVDERLQFLVG
ncbi:YciI family protein [Kaarinaea lacus]